MTKRFCDLCGQELINGLYMTTVKKAVPTGNNTHSFIEEKYHIKFSVHKVTSVNIVGAEIDACGKCASELLKEAYVR